MYQRLLLTPFGELVLVANEGKLVYCNWNEKDCEQKLKRVVGRKDHNEGAEDVSVVDKAACQIDEFCEGRLREFELPCEMRGTEFQKSVWRILMEIPYGETLTYKDVAKLIGRPKAVRAVAAACGANPLALIIPCHRVVASNGTPGGYTGGLDKKLSLLQHELRFN